MQKRKAKKVENNCSKELADLIDSTFCAVQKLKDTVVRKQVWIEDLSSDETKQLIDAIRSHLRLRIYRKSVGDYVTIEVDEEND